MRYLLDTHTLIWWAAEPDKLSDRVRQIIRSGDNQIFLSAASTWELALKAQIGKIQFNRPISAFVADEMSRNHFQILPVSIAHTLATSELPLLHRDPFDRLLVAQSRLEKLPILTADAWICRYDVQAEW